MDIIITLIIISIPLGIYLFKLKKDKEFAKAKDKINSEVNNFTTEEREVVEKCNELFSNPKVDTVVVRDPKQKILHYEGRVWSKVASTGSRAFYSHKHKTIFIKRFDKNGEVEDLLTFAKLYIHEMNHFRGYDHGPEMEARDRKQIQEVKEAYFLNAEH